MPDPEINHGVRAVLSRTGYPPARVLHRALSNSPNSPRRAWENNCPPSVFFRSTTCLRACSVVKYTKLRGIP